MRNIKIPVRSRASACRPRRALTIRALPCSPGNKNAHASAVAGVEWLGPQRLVSAGADGCAKVWEVTFHA